MSCTSQSTDYAPDHNYYFQVSAMDSSEATKRIVAHLQSELPKYRYTFTYGSGKQWPYYKSLTPDEDVPLDSLMPPHVFLHKMVPYEVKSRIEEGEFLVQVAVGAEPDSVPKYTVTILRQHLDSLELSAATGVHQVDSTQYSSMQELADLFLKNIVRYSFK